MTLSAVIPTRHNFTGNDVNESFSYTVKITDQDHIKLVHTDTDGLENTLADPLVVDVDYTVNGVDAAGGGTVDFPKAGSVYSTLATGEKLAIIYVFPIEQGLDLPNLGRMFNEAVEDQLDYMTILHNQAEEKLDRAIKLVEGSTLTDIAWPEGADAAARKNKLIAWNDDSDALELASSIGTFRGDWATATAYTARDTVKDTSNNNIYQANTTHTSTGSLPISTNADVAKWDLIVDAAAATAAGEAVANKYTFDDSTSMADPGTGDIRLDNATIASVTNIAIDALSADSGNPDVSDFIASWDDGTNITHEGYITIKKVGEPATFAVYSLTGAVVDNTGWLQLPVTHVDSNGSLTDADELYVSFARSGNRGNDAGLDMTFESLTTDVDQGAGKTWLNNATPSSATVFYMDDEDANGADINSWVDSWDDSSSTIKGQIELSKQADPAVFALYNVTGAVTDASGYSKVAVTYVTGAGSFTDADPVNVAFTRAGDKGDNGSLVNVVEDLTPQFGGPVDGQGNDLNNMGVLFLTEQAEAEASVAGKGQLWVDTAAPNVLMFTDDDDTDFRLSYTPTGTGDLVLATSPTLVTPELGAATATSVVASSNYLLEGYATGRNVLRMIVLRIDAGGTPGTNIDIAVQDQAGASKGFNTPTITDATNLAKSGTSGSFSLNAGGTAITMDLTETIVGTGVAVISLHDLNNSSTAAGDIWFCNISVTSGNVAIRFRQTGGVADEDLTGILQAGDRVDIQMTIITSS